jgi:DNA-binding transcriptional MerR regulator
MAKKASPKSSGAAKKPARRVASTQAASKASREPSAGEAGEEEIPPDAEGIEPADLSGLKAGKLYYRIGEVSQITGVKPYVLRYWESEFRLMAPQKSRSKQRLYRQKDIETILAIKRLLYAERYTIAGARRRLRELGRDARGALAAEAAEEHAEELTARDHYRRIRDELLAIRSLLAAEL